MLEEKESAGNGDDAGKITEDDIKGAASTMYAAGTDTTLSTLVIFVLCMVLNPDVQERARQELDRVVSRDLAYRVQHLRLLRVSEKQIYITTHCLRIRFDASYRFEAIHRRVFAPLALLVLLLGLPLRSTGPPPILSLALRLPPLR